MDYTKANLMKFYEGAVSYSDLQKMPIPEIMNLNNLASRINKEKADAEKAATRKK